MPYVCVLRLRVLVKWESGRRKSKEAAADGVCASIAVKQVGRLKLKLHLRLLGPAVMASVVVNKPTAALADAGFGGERTTTARAKKMAKREKGTVTTTTPTVP